MLRGLQFEPWVAPVQHWRNRMDVACFIGYSRRQRSRAVPESVLQWLAAEGWIDTPGQPQSEVDSDSGRRHLPAGIEQLPIPIDSWSMFEALFEVESASVDVEYRSRIPSYLAAAVRSFFAQGGRRCFVIYAEHPDDLHLRSSEMRRRDAVTALVPSHRLAGAPVPEEEPDDRGRWRGIGLLHALDDVTMLCLPDLPWLVGELPDWLEPLPEKPIPRDRFFECSDLARPRVERVRRPPVELTRSDQSHYRDWAAVVRRVTTFLAGYRRDVQFIATLPMPKSDNRAARDLLDALIAWGILERSNEGEGSPSNHGVANRFLQLVYPWFGWRGSQGLPEGLEPGDGAMAGLIARRCLVAGAFRTVSGQELYDIDRIAPQLSHAHQHTEALEPTASGAPQANTLIDRIALFGRVQRRFELLSDVTTSGGHQFQLANMQRLSAVWIRALKHVGESFVFEASSEATWRRLRGELEQVGLALFRNGAFLGQGPLQAFRIRCDRSTMSQRDIDSGRLVAEIEYRPAAPLELIRVSLALSENREVSVLRERSQIEEVGT